MPYSIVVKGTSTLAVGKSAKATYNLVGYNFKTGKYDGSPTNTSVVWESSNPDVATVKAGSVKAKQAGTTTIKVSTVANPDVWSEFELTVKPATKKIKVTADDSLNTIDLSSGDPTIQLSAASTPEDACQDVVWSSSNAKVASVDDYGLVTGLKNGTVIITAKAVDGTNVKGTYKITVITTATAISVADSKGNKNIELSAGKSTTLKVNLTGTENSKVTSTKVTYSSNSNLITVNSSGKISVNKRASRGMKATITITTTDGSNIFDTVEVTVK